MSVRKVATKSSTTSMLELKTELLKWICERHATNEPLDRKLLRAKAMEFATSFGVIGFKCSEAWLTLFLKKHGFSPSLTSCDGPTFPDYRAWIDLLRSLLTQYRHKDLFSVDELVMYPIFFPSRKRVDIPFQRHGDDVFTEIARITPLARRIVILLCCNSSGTEKLEPLISDPRASDRSMEESRENRQFGCSTSDENFGTWLEKLNNRMSESQRRILLLLGRDRIRSLHDVQRLSNVKLVFLPRDFPPHLRPLRGDVFHSVKMTYRRGYAEFVRRRESTGLSSEWDTREIVAGILEAWKSVPQELVVSSFQRTKFREDESFLKIQCPEWDSLGTGMSFRKFVTFDDELCDEASDRRVNRGLRFNAIANSEHRYNLRKSHRPTLELTHDTIDERSRQISRSNRKFGEVDRQECLEKGSSRTRKTPENLELPVPDKTRGETRAQNLSSEAGPSGTAKEDGPMTFGSGDPEALEFDDEEKIHEETGLRLQILNAIETCGDADELSRSSDPSPGSSKRSRTGANESTFEVDENERARKVARNDANWSKRYETNFVFGPEVDGNPEPSTDDGSRRQTGNEEIEKRCIFTLEGSANMPNASYPQSKD